MDHDGERVMADLLRVSRRRGLRSRNRGLSQGLDHASDRTSRPAAAARARGAGSERQPARPQSRRPLRAHHRHPERAPLDHRRDGGAPRPLFWQRRPSSGSTSRASTTSRWSSASAARRSPAACGRWRGERRTRRSRHSSWIAAVFPPTLIQVGSAETRSSPTRRAWAAKVGAADVAVTLEIWPRMFHAWRCGTRGWRRGGGRWRRS
jgi:acetyl esterase/lipase